MDGGVALGDLQGARETPGSVFWVFFGGGVTEVTELSDCSRRPGAREGVLYLSVHFTCCGRVYISNYFITDFKHLIYIKKKVYLFFPPFLFLPFLERDINRSIQ